MKIILESGTYELLITEQMKEVLKKLQDNEEYAIINQRF